MTFEQKLEEQILNVISNWNDVDIYAISFLLTTNELSVYSGICNFPEFSIGYNTERDCCGAGSLSEERWNFACWSQNNIVLFDAEHRDMSDALLEWYEEQGIVDIGVENEDEMYDENFNYIGKGPVGYYELLMMISCIAQKLQINGTIKNKFGDVPIIVHDLDYSWYVKVATENANPNGEAKDFLLALSKGFE